jgi:AAA+ ATPase superfamily predicted ATPase
VHREICSLWISTDLSVSIVQDKSVERFCLLVARESEIDLFQGILESKRPRFMAIYGRRRVGKTHLVREFFFSRSDLLTITGRKGLPQGSQLAIFNEEVAKFSPKSESTYPQNWHEAFLQLTEELVQRSRSGKKQVVFFDELPWLCANRKSLLSEIDYFWNTQWSQMSNVVIIICGSAASWLILNRLLLAKLTNFL